MFEKIKIVGEKAKEEKEKQDYIKYQQEMRVKLFNWECDNSCIVTPILASPQNRQSITFIAQIEIKKLNLDELNEYKRTINGTDKPITI